MHTLPVSVTMGSEEVGSLQTRDFRVTQMRFAPLLDLPRHYHEHACLSVILEGAFEEVFTGAAYDCPAASVVAKPAGEWHADHYTRTGARVLAIELAGSQVSTDDLPSELFERISHFRNGVVEAIAWRIVKELEAPDAFTHLAVEGLLLELLAMSARRHSPPPARRPPPWLDLVREALHARFAEPLQLASLAAEVGVNPDHLARVFSAHHGVSIGEYVRRLRLDWAASCLSTSDVPLSDLALRAGFSDQSHFTRVFKRHTGLTPERYRCATRR